MSLSAKKIKLTKLERYWILYDVGNSAFILLTATLLPIYFHYLGDLANLSSVEYLSYWGYTTSIVTLIVACIGPVLGSLSDTKGYKKKLFLCSILIGSISCALLGSAKSWLVFLIIFCITKLGVSTSLIFYDSMLTDITEKDRVDIVSAQGYAWGYIGSCIPFGVSLILVLGGSQFGISFETAMICTFILIGSWWFVVSIPLLKNYKQRQYVEVQEKVIINSFKRIIDTFRDIRKEKHIFLFLLAFFFYIDGVYTIIDMATAYGEALGLDSTGLLMALLVTQIVAFPSSIAFGYLSRKYENRNLIAICIIAYTGIAIFGYFLHTQTQFWILAVCVGLFQGGIQALSRSYFAQIIPANKSGEYFGLLDICGKGASFLGTAMVSVVSQLSGSINLGVGVISVLFVIGFILFYISSIYRKELSSLALHTDQQVDV